MFSRFRSAPETSKLQLQEVTTVEACEELFLQDLTIVFKHSNSCGTSWMAHREVVRFRQLSPETRVVLLPVLERRSLSRYVAERFSIDHESPQVLVIRKNRLVSAVSHDEITAELLLELLDRV